MKYQNQFSVQIKKISICPVELAQRVLKVKLCNLNSKSLQQYFSQSGVNKMTTNIVTTKKFNHKIIYKRKKCYKFDLSHEIIKCLA